MRLSVPLLALVAALLTYASRGVLWSDTVDIAHHYALVVRLGEHFNGSFPYDPSLVEMNAYPRHAHQLASLLGGLLGSPLRGMQALSVLGMVGAWSCLAWLLMQLPQRMAVVCAAALAALLVLNRYVLHLPLQGDELVGNFFLPQLLGQALVLLLMLGCWYAEQRGRAPTLRYVLLAPAVVLLAGVHLLPALVLLAVMALLIATDLLVQWRQRQPGARAWLALLALVGAGAGVLLHPAFATMREISKNNGYIALPYWDSTAALMGYSAAVALASLALLLYWLRQGRVAALGPVKYVGVYGLAVSGLALAQGVALLLGMGSDYALRKYAYSLNTVALIALALLPALLLARKAGKPGKQWAHWALPPLLTLLACLAVAGYPAKHKMKELVAVEQQVQELRAHIGAPPAGKSDYAIHTGQNAIMDYMFSIGQLRIPRLENVNAASLLYDHEIDEWRGVGRVITALNSKYDRYPACRIGAPAGTLVAVDGACVARLAAAGARIDFTSANTFFPCALTGVSHREPAGSWTSPQATLRCPRLPVNGKPPGRVEITGTAFGGDLAPRRAIATVDGLPPQTEVYRAAAAPLVLPLRAGSNEAEVVIELALPDAVSPLQLGMGQDGRQLGLSLRSLEFKE